MVSDVIFGYSWGNPELKVRVSRYFTYSDEVDIAIFKLARIINFSETIQPVQLPPLSATGSTYDNKKTTVVGWGPDAKPRYADMKVLSNTECLLKNNDPWLDCRRMCAVGFNNQKAGICDGDRGGSLVIQENNEFTVIGISYYAIKCGDGKPSRFTRVSSFLKFINGVTGIPLRQN